MVGPWILKSDFSDNTGEAAGVWSVGLASCLYSAFSLSVEIVKL